MSEHPGSGASGQPSTCPSCGATVRADVPWCTQCYAELRPERTQPPASVAPGDDQGPHDDQARAADLSEPGGAGVHSTHPAAPQVTDPYHLDPRATGPRHLDPSAAAAQVTGPQDVERLADQMLAELAGQRDEVQGLAARLPSTPAGRTALVAVVIVAGTALALLVMFVLGSLG